MEVQPGLEKLDLQEEARHQGWVENTEIQRKSCLKQLIRPILFTMAIAGCYNFSDLYDSIQEKDRKWTRKLILSYLYRLLVFVILLLFMVKFVVGITVLPSQYYVMLGLGLGWVAYLIAQFLVCLKSTSCKYGHQEDAFQFWKRRIIPACSDLQFECRVKPIQRRTLVVTVVACVSVAINIITFLIQVLVFDGGQLYLAPIEENGFTLTILIAFQTWASFVWIIPHAHAVVISISLCQVFKDFNKHLADAIVSPKNTVLPSLQRLRILHMDASKLVSNLDSDFTYFYGFSVASNIAVCVFTLYQVIRTELDTFSLGMYMYWFIVGLMLNGITTMFAAFLNDEVGITALAYIFFLYKSQNVC